MNKDPYIYPKSIDEVPSEDKVERWELYDSCSGWIVRMNKHYQPKQLLENRVSIRYLPKQQPESVEDYARRYTDSLFYEVPSQAEWNRVYGAVLAGAEWQRRNE